ncbi:MAG: hypothetical protein ABSG92_11310 [Conexivisphaerales archaeon]
MEKGKMRRLLRRYSKPACFFLVVFLLLAFSEFTVSYREIPAGAVALPEQAKDKITIVTIGGMLQVSYNQQEGEASDNVNEAVTVATFNMSNDEVYMQPLETQALGCGNNYLSPLTVSVKTSNQLAYEEKGAVNVSVLDSAGEFLYASQILVLDFKPGAFTSGAANFSIETSESNPTFLVRVAFPTQEDLNAANVTVAHMPLFEYVLMKLGIAVP